MDIVLAFFFFALGIAPDAEPVKEGNVISTDFWNNLQTNGRAAVHIRR